MNKKEGRKCSNGDKKKGINSCLKDKNLLIVNTGYKKKEFIFKKIQKLGINIICLNSEINWADQYVDEWIIADTYNHNESIQAVERYVKGNKNKIDGLITFWEDDVLLTSKITDKLNLTGIPYKVASRTRNKFLFRKFCTEQNLPTSNHIFIKSKKDLKKVKEKLNFPIVLKPIFGSLTAMVVKVDTDEELEKIYNFVVKNISTKVETALHDGLEIFAEEYIDGDEVDIDIILQNGRIKLAIVSDNFDKSRGKFFLDKGQATPSNLPTKAQEELVNMAELVLEKLGIFNGCIHFEAKYSSRGPIPLEANLRMGGDYVYSYLKTAWNLDMIELAAMVSLNEYIPVYRELEPKKYVIGWDFSTENSGILNEITIDNKLKKRKFFEEICLYKELGDAVLVPPEGFETLGWLTVSGENPLDVNDNLQESLKLVNYKISRFDYLSFTGKTEKRDSLSNATIAKNYLLNKERINYLTSTEIKDLDLTLITNVDKFNNQKFFNYFKKLSNTLTEKDYKVTEIINDNPQFVLNALRSKDFDLIINLINIEGNNFISNFNVLKAIEISNIPFTGTDSCNVKEIQNKIKTKKIFKYHEIPTPEWDYVYDKDDEIDEGLNYPLIVKPSNRDFKAGIDETSVVFNQDELREKILFVLKNFQGPVLIEEFLEGDEYEIIVTGNEDTDLKAFPINKIHYKNSYKKVTGRINLEENRELISNEYPVKNINLKLEKILIETAFDVFRVMECRDYAKIDFRLDKNGNPNVIEVNTSPFLKYTGIPIEKVNFYETILQSAINRYKAKSI